MLQRKSWCCWYWMALWHISTSRPSTISGSMACSHVSHTQPSWSATLSRHTSRSNTLEQPRQYTLGMLSVRDGCVQLASFENSRTRRYLSRERFIAATSLITVWSRERTCVTALRSSRGPLCTVRDGTATGGNSRCPVRLMVSMSFWKRDALPALSSATANIPCTKASSAAATSACVRILACVGLSPSPPLIDCRSSYGSLANVVTTSTNAFANRRGSTSAIFQFCIGVHSV
mmetsp:Transcript_58488/g.127184  ORF Transcript_58488/g.127184 Transcript_58488/m.127184 type:complete len:232 (-) Transcript_58488:14-709(-)